MAEEGEVMRLDEPEEEREGKKGLEVRELTTKPAVAAAWSERARRRRNHGRMAVVRRDGVDDGDGWKAPAEAWLGEEVEDVEVRPSVASAWRGVTGGDGATVRSEDSAVVLVPSISWSRRKKKGGAVRSGRSVSAWR